MPNVSFVQIIGAGILGASAVLVWGQWQIVAEKPPMIISPRVANPVVVQDVDRTRTEDGRWISVYTIESPRKSPFRWKGGEHKQVRIQIEADTEHEELRRLHAILRENGLQVVYQQRQVHERST